MEITDEQVQAAEAIASDVYDKTLTLKAGANLLSDVHGLNKSSARDFIRDYAAMMNGKVFHRAMSAPDINYFLTKIRERRGAASHSLAVVAVEKHIEYFEQQRKVRLRKMREVLEGHRKLIPLAADPLIANRPVLVHRNPAVWRLIAHHESPLEAMEAMVANDAIAIGWTNIGDLCELAPGDSKEISKAIGAVYPDLQNAGPGGASLWRLLHQVTQGDLIIVSAAGARSRVMEIVGDYFFSPEAEAILGYRHQRAAVLTNIDPNELWEAYGADVAEGENVRWTLARCSGELPMTQPVFDEGRRFEITSTAIERNPRARQACLDHYGYSCQVCAFDFEKTFGDIGRGYIHVHHRVDLSFTSGPQRVDPITDLIPLCPNCHAMAHSTRPATPVEDLRKILSSRRSRGAES